MPQYLGKLLVERGLLTAEQLDSALAQQKKTDRPLGQILVDLELTTLDALLNVVSEQAGVPGTRINAYTVDPAVVPVVPERIARRHTALPLFRVGNTLTIAIADPKDLRALDDLRFATGCDIQPVVALEEELTAALDRYYREDVAPLPDAEGLVEVEGPRSASFERDLEADESATRLVDQILARAVGDRASDIHLEPEEKYLRLRIRVDGVLGEVARLPGKLSLSVVARIKVLGGMDISEHRLPQDGRFTATVSARRIDLRVSTYPTVWGEKAVLRLLDREALRLRLADTGMLPEFMNEYRNMIRRPEGIILITGPTGSGKTSTLYATLADLTGTGLNIVTLENPVEYEIEGITQGQTNDKAGFTFASGLRAILRQDPDVILVGEIRDRETLDVSIEAALTGHLVLSTLHTNSAVSTVTRLLEMELEPYLLASTLVGIVAQRLVRRICNGCRKTVPAPPETRHFFPPPGPTELHRGAGCRECRGTGYRRRSGIYEMLRMTEKIRELILQRASEDTLAAANRANGLASLRDDGIAHVLDGTTTLDEVLRVAQEKQ